MLRTSCRSVKAPVGVFFVITTVMRGEGRGEREGRSARLNFACEKYLTGPHRIFLGILVKA